MLQKVTRLDSVPTAEETVLTTEVPTKESRLYTLLHFGHINSQWQARNWLIIRYLASLFKFKGAN